MTLCICGRPMSGRGERCGRWCGHGPTLDGRERNARYRARHARSEVLRHVRYRIRMGAQPRYPLVPYLLAGGRL